MIDLHQLLPLVRSALALDGTGPLVRINTGGKYRFTLQMESDPGDSVEETGLLLANRIALYRKKHKATPGRLVFPGGVTISAGWDFYKKTAGTDNSLEDDFTLRFPGRYPGRAAGKVVVVTGGARGFGEGIARGMAKEGAFIFIADRDIKAAKSALERINADIGRTTGEAVYVDVTDESSVAGMCRGIVEKVGGFDVYVSNAGVLKAGSVMTMSGDDFNFVTAANYTGYFYGVKYAAPIMALYKNANPDYVTDIIQINSKSGLAGSNRNGAYAGSKFGGIGLTQSFALELAADNIKVNSVCPGNFFEGPLWSDPEKGLFVQYLREAKVPGAKSVEDIRAFYESKVPMGRGCRPEDVTRAVLYCIEQRYETGQALPVTGGQIMLH